MQCSWPETDRTIEVHANALFADDVPRIPTDYHRSNGILDGGYGRTEIFRHEVTLEFPYCSGFVGDMLEREESGENALLQLEGQIEERHLPLVELNKKKQSSSFGRRRQLSPVQILSRFQQYLPLVVEELRID